MKKLSGVFGIVGNGIGYVFFRLCYPVVWVIEFIFTVIFTAARYVTKCAFPIGVLATFYISLTNAYHDSFINSAKTFFSVYSILSKQVILLAVGSVIIGAITVFVFNVIFGFINNIHNILFSLKDKTENAILLRKENIRNCKKIARFGTTVNIYEAEKNAFRNSSNYFERF